MSAELNYLKNTSWGKPALSLLKHMKSIDPDKPAILMLRHSERNEITDDIEIPLNESGIQAAYEFGLLLPNHLKYHFYHSPIVRCKETAENIKKGIEENHGKTDFLEEMKSLTRVFIVGKKYFEYLSREGENFVYNWIAGHYPPWEVNTSLNVAKRTMFELYTFLERAKKNDICICSSHDLQVTAYLFHWAGILATESYIQFLDGFIMQVYNNKMVFYHKNGIKEVKLPYWLK